MGMLLSDPVSVWYFCVSVSVPVGSFQLPCTFAGTTQNSAVHQDVQSSLIVSLNCAASCCICILFGPSWMSG